MRVLSLNINKLAAMILPTFMRKPRILALVGALVAPLRGVYQQFHAERSATLQHLITTGQVCILRHALCEALQTERFVVRDFQPSGQWVVVYDLGHADHEPLIIHSSADASVDHLIIYDISRMVHTLNSFEVVMPQAIWSDADKRARVKAIVATYKLATTTANYSSTNN